jgi:hypothetical protein
VPSIQSGAAWRSELYCVTCDQFAAAADVLELDPEFSTRLLEPRAEVLEVPCGRPRRRPTRSSWNPG